jgi:hypothetical protein
VSGHGPKLPASLRGDRSKRLRATGNRHRNSNGQPPPQLQLQLQLQLQQPEHGCHRSHRTSTDKQTALFAYLCFSVQSVVSVFRLLLFLWLWLWLWRPQP